jgi:hypothetical protein
MALRRIDSKELEEMQEKMQQTMPQHRSERLDSFEKNRFQGAAVLERRRLVS